MNALFFKLTCILLLMLPGIAMAQQVQVLSDGVDFSGKIGASQRKTILLHNESPTTKTYFLKNVRGSVGSSQKMRVCFGDQCFDPKKDLAKIALRLAPGEIYTDFYLEFDLGISETMGSFELVFVNSEALRDLFVIEARYAVTSDSKAAFSYKDVKLSEIYPNPSSRVAQLDYTLVNPKAKAKISVTSFIGNPIAEYDLDPERNSLVINVSEFQAGVYFYTLFVDNKNVVTKKLQVKK